MHFPSFGQTDTAESGSFLPSAACFFILAALRLSPWCGDQLSSQAVPQRAARWRHPLYLSHLPIHWIYRRHAKSRTEYSFYYGLLFLFLSLYRRTATTSLFTRDCHNGILSSLFLSLGESHRRSLHCLSICHVCKYFASESMLRLEMTAEDSSPYWDINMHYLLLLHWLTKTWPLRVRPSSLPPYPAHGAVATHVLRYRDPDLLCFWLGIVEPWLPAALRWAAHDDDSDGSGEGFYLI